MTSAIIVVGGYNSIWPAYLQISRYLEELARIPCVAVPLMPWDWWQAARHKDATHILRRLERTATWACQRLSAERLILVGHSAGGLISRLYVCDLPVWGRRYVGQQQVDRLITLGSPHCSDRGTRTGWFLADEANRLAPGVPHSTGICYRAVAGESVLGKQDGDWRERRAFRAHSFFGAQGQEWGDGAVPLACAALAGAEFVCLAGVTHSRNHGRNWYGGSVDIIRRWWPEDAR